MKKLTFILLLASCLGVIISLALLILGYHIFTSAYFLICSTVSCMIFFTLNLVKKENYFLFPFSAGIVLISLFFYGFFINPDLLKNLWEYLFTGILLISNLGIHHILKKQKNIFADLTRYTFWISNILMIYILVTKENTEVFYTIEYILLTIATISLVVSVLLPEKKKVNY